MRQIGPSLFVGGDPYVCFLAAEIEEESRRRNLDRRIETNGQPPSDSFLSLLKERTTKPKRYGFVVDHSYYRFGDDTLISIYKTNGLAGVPDSKKFMVHLESIYVVDVARGQGYGTACIDMLTEVAEETGCVIGLFCNPFVWSFDGVHKYALESFDKLWEVVFDDRWDILYHTDMQSELTKLFYARLGFVNMCLYDKWVYGRDKTEDLPFEQQFAYLPASLSQSYKGQLLNRLSLEGCEYCNRA